MAKHKHKAIVERDPESGWWLIDVPGIGYTECRRLDSAKATAADSAALWHDVDIEDVEIELEVALPDRAAAMLALDQSAGRVAALAQEVAANAKAALTRHLLHDLKLTGREAGVLMGLSHQRVAQLANASEAELTLVADQLGGLFEEMARAIVPLEAMSPSASGGIARWIAEQCPEAYGDAPEDAMSRSSSP